MLQNAKPVSLELAGASSECGKHKHTTADLRRGASEVAKLYFLGPCIIDLALLGVREHLKSMLQSSELNGCATSVWVTLLGERSVRLHDVVRRNMSTCRT